jgi:hypothetical protein
MFASPRRVRVAGRRQVGMSYKSCALPGTGLIAIRWGATPEAPDVPAYAAEIAQAREREGGPIVALFIMPPDSVAPPEDFRKVQAQHLPDIMSNLDYAIAVFEGTGFKSSLKRSALVAILLLAPKRYPIFVRATVEEALIHNPPKPVRFDPVKAIAELTRRGVLSPV